MSSIFGGRTAAPQEENARFNGKPVAAPADAGARGVTRRALGEINNAANVRPVGSRPVTAPALPATASTDSSMMGMDIDSADSEDPACVSEYVADIYSHYKSCEVARSARLGYMQGQADINDKMRAILIDWLVEVHQKFKLMPETMYLTVNIIDRFLEKKQIIRQKLQLVGVTAMLLASKYEEIYAPEVHDFVYITDKAYTKEQILAMEAVILNTLEFRITVPTSYVFLNRFLKVANADAPTTLLATYLSERTLQEYKCLNHSPSKLAAAAVNIALRTKRGRAAWDRKMELYTGFTQDVLRAPIQEIEEFILSSATNNLKAVNKKFSLPKFGEVALGHIQNLDA